MRSFDRSPAQMRPVSMMVDANAYAEGSCLIKFGNTHILCTASVEDRVPGFLRNSGKGWITAEYGMLPRSTHSRMDRKRSAESGRTQEISRLIGRSLRSIANLKAFGERQIIVDCDVLQADGGTRTAAITGAFVCLTQAFAHLDKLGALNAIPLNDHVAAISCGIVQNEVCCDLDYKEDSNAALDANFVMSAAGGLIEVQATGETQPFDDAHLTQMIGLARDATQKLVAAQQTALQGLPLEKLIKPKS
ncbi:MAG: ribonuclease PH [Alphaproteobacteria bacterium]